MKSDTVKLLSSKVITIMLLVGAFYALVLYENLLPELVTGAIISWVTLALNSEYSDQASTRNARQQQAAYDKGVQTPTPNASMTATNADSVTVGPPGNG